MDDFSNFASSFKWRLSTIVLWVETLVVNLLFHSFISGWLWSVKRTEIWDISSEVSVCWICLFYFISLRSLCCSFLFSSTSSPRYTAHTFSSYWSFHFLCSLHFFGLRIILHKCAFLLLLFIVSFICCLVGLHRTAGQDSATEYVNVYVALKKLKEMCSSKRAKLILVWARTSIHKKTAGEHSLNSFRLHQIKKSNSLIIHKSFCYITLLCCFVQKSRWLSAFLVPQSQNTTVEDVRLVIF